MGLITGSPKGSDESSAAGDYTGRCRGGRSGAVRGRTHTSRKRVRVDESEGPFGTGSEWGGEPEIDLVLKVRECGNLLVGKEVGGCGDRTVGPGDDPSGLGESGSVPPSASSREPLLLAPTVETSEGSLPGPEDRRTPKGRRRGRSAESPTIPVRVTGPRILRRASRDETREVTLVAGD